MTPMLAKARPLSVTLKAADGYTATRSFKTLAGAQAFAQKYVGPTPEFGSTYAVAPDGLATISVSGAALVDLFPAMKAEQEALAREAAQDAADEAARAEYQDEDCPHGLSASLCGGPMHWYDNDAPF